MRPGVKRRGRPSKVKPANLFPDLVAQAIGWSVASGREDASLALARVVAETADEAGRLDDALPQIADPGAGPAADRGLKTGGEKSSSDPRKLEAGDEKSESGACKLEAGVEKSESGARKLKECDLKSERGPRKLEAEDEKSESGAREHSEPG